MQAEKINYQVRNKEKIRDAQKNSAYRRKGQKTIKNNLKWRKQVLLLKLAFKGFILFRA